MNFSPPLAHLGETTLEFCSCGHWKPSSFFLFKFVSKLFLPLCCTWVSRLLLTRVLGFILPLSILLYIYSKFHALYVLQWICHLRLGFILSLTTVLESLPLLSLAVDKTPVRSLKQYSQLPSVLLTPVLLLCCSACAKFLFIDDSTPFCVASPHVRTSLTLRSSNAPFECVGMWNIHISRFVCVSGF